MFNSFQKSVRASDGSAALYWLARMLTAGLSTPLFIHQQILI
jgi:replication-associated recombination protein RarA